MRRDICACAVISLRGNAMARASVRLTVSTSRAIGSAANCTNAGAAIRKYSRSREGDESGDSGAAGGEEGGGDEHSRGAATRARSGVSSDGARRPTIASIGARAEMPR